MKISDADLGWMAAIIDAKGHVHTKNNKMRNTQQVTLLIDSKDHRIAEKLSTLTGTKPMPHERPDRDNFIRRGCVVHCPEAHIHTHADDVYPWQMPVTTRWGVSGVAMGIVLWNLRKYMTTYPEYAKYMGIAFDQAVLTGRGSGQVRVAVTRLRELGWRIPPRIERQIATIGTVDSEGLPERGVLLVPHL